MYTAETRSCKECKNSFVIEPDDFGFYEKMGAPAPANCPECRFKWRALFRNEMTLYSRQCDLCQKKMISVYHAKAPYTVYCQECYDSDKWDPFSYKQDYDEAKPFFDQFGALMERVPKRALGITTGSGPNVNSDYTNVASSNKNCYLVFNTSLCEDSMYSRGLKNCKEAIDTYFGVGMERCYEAVNVNQSNGVIFGQNCTSCVDCIFAMNLSGCTNCFGCVNLRNKSHCFFNEQLTKEEYDKRVGEIMGSHTRFTEARKKFEEFSLEFPRRQDNNLKSVDSVGDYLFECKNSKESFEQSNCEDCKFGFANKNAKNCYDIMGYGYNCEFLLDSCASGLSSNCIGAYWAELSRNIEYSYFVKNCNDCIGCDGLKNGSYCVLNKKYTKEEYQKIREKIVTELKAKELYGMFIPPKLSPFAYNETIGYDNFPITKEEAIAAGFRWQDDVQMTKGKGTLTSENIPDNIKDVPASMVKEVLTCINCERNYLITPAELQFYQKMKLPIPRRCFFCRHADRLLRRGPMKIFDRTCGKCGKEMKTTYSPKSPEKVYCIPCYQAEVA